MSENNPMSGYPSIDKPWLKLYSEDAINAPLPECSLYEYLWECNNKYLHEYALNYFGRKITYRTLFNLIDKAAKAFQAIGVKENEIVSIVTVSTVASTVCFYALNRIGAVSNYLNVLAEEGDLRSFFDEASSQVVVCLDLFSEKVLNATKGSAVRKVIIIPTDYEMPFIVKAAYRLKAGKKLGRDKRSDKIVNWNRFLKMASGISTIEYKKDPHKMCLLAHTGGTTGEPKAVMLDDCAMNAAASQYLATFDAKRKDVFLNLMIPFVVYGIIANIHVPLCFGWESVIIPKFQSQDWYSYIKKYRPTHILAVPAYAIPLLDEKRLSSLDMSCLKTVAVGGDGMTKETEEDLNRLFAELNSPARVMPGYGMTEACATATGCFTKMLKPGSVGVPLPKYNVMIFDDETKSELKYGQIGEVCLQCPSRMIGYMNNEEATRQLFHTHDDGSEWLHTGDLGYIDEDGFLFLVGRIKRMILTTKNGIAYKVFPNITEKILEEHPSVLRSCVVGALENDNQVLKAFIMVSEGFQEKAPQIEHEIRQLCEEKLPSYARPTFYKFKDHLPLTAAGKIDYRTLEIDAEKGA